MDDGAAHEQLFFEGTSHLKRGDAARAVACLRRALASKPDFAEAHANLGLALQQSGALREAEQHYLRALALAPQYAQTHMNFGCLLFEQKRLHEAEIHYRQALALDPRSPAHWSNLGVLYACQKRELEAEKCYRVALELDPEHRRTQHNLSYVLLRQGRFEEGWRRFEAREGNAAIAAGMTCPRWRGEPLEGKSILLTHEAGLGDMLQCCRYAALVRARGAAQLGMLCHPALARLFSALPDVDRAIAADREPPSAGFDCWAPLFSLPFHFGTRLESIPDRLPYLFARPDEIAAWDARLPRAALRVGLCWRGNPSFENDAERSLPALDALAPLAGIAGVSFISLQKGAGEQEAKSAPGLIAFDAAPHIRDFADTAALMAHLDLTISVDTAVAHLAGALGKRCWVLLPDYKTDWRWLAERSDSPWYPGVMRLFRQARAGDWSETIAQVRVELERFALHA